MDIIENIKKRISTRTFNQVALKTADKKNLESFINENNKGLEDEVLNFQIIEKHDVDKQMKLDYGMIKGHNSYILGTSKTSLASRVNYGYLMEKVVLKATEMKMSTCWIGVFDCTYFNEVFLEDGFEIPSIVIVGYSNDKPTYQDKFLRFSVKASSGRRFYIKNKLFLETVDMISIF